MAPPRKSDVLDGEGADRSGFRPSIGGRGGEVPVELVPRLRNAVLALITRLGMKSSPAPGRSRGISSVRDVRASRAFSRRCVVKARFVPMNGYGARAAALHLAYIEREGVERDGSSGRVYGPAEIVDVRESLSDPLESEKCQFRFIVHPRTVARST
jgi:hypothetical protein